LRSLFFLFFLSFSLVSFACHLSPVCCLSNKLPDAPQINVFLVAKANRPHKKTALRDGNHGAALSFTALTAFRSLGAANQHGSGGEFGFGPERLGPEGAGGTPPLASFTGLRSRSLIVFFFLSFILVLF
jgi:hypothetical protein